jgi:hypothetical protein
LVHPSFLPSDAVPRGTHKPSAPEPSGAPVPRLPHGPRSSHQPGKQHDKSDSLSIYRAGLLRELDSDLRGQWPHSFQRTVQVCALEHFFFLVQVLTLKVVQSVLFIVFRMNGATSLCSMMQAAWKKRATSWPS